ncbi:MAG: hypothetical protein L0Y56_05525 [Nitrospira sp.]|nr:hypothetical protein [Nitrospira sp.]
MKRKEAIDVSYMIGEMTVIARQLSPTWLVLGSRQEALLSKLEYRAQLIREFLLHSIDKEEQHAG